MDDLQFFISSRAETAANVYEDGRVSGHREYESLDLHQTIAKISVSYHAPLRSNSYSVASVRQYPSQSRFQWLISDKKQHFQSQWHQALERLEEKRRWRTTSAKLSEVFSRWLVRRRAKECRDAPDSQGIIYDKASEGQPSVTATLISYSETKTSTIIQQSIVEICEIPTETGGLENVESIEDTATVQVIDEGVHGDSAKNPVTPDLDLKNIQTSSRSSVRIEGTDTPDRPKDSPFTSTASSPLTPMSRGPFRFLENTPDTPESTLRPSQRTSETESPFLKQLDSTDRSSALFTAPTSAFTAPTLAFTAPSAFTAPTSAFTAPTSAFTAPTSAFTAPTSAFTAPTSAFTAPTPLFTAPTPLFTAPTPLFTAPTPLFTAPKPFEHPPLPNNVFSQQNWISRRDQGLQSRPLRSPVSRTLFPSLEKDVGNAIRPQALFSWTQTEADSTGFPPHKDSIKIESPTLGGTQIHPSYSEVVTKHEQQHIPALGNAMAVERSLWEYMNGAQSTPAKTSPISSLSFQLPPAKPLSHTVIPTITSRFANALEVYDVVVNDSTRKLFEANARRCFARTLKGERCKRWQINGSRESIRLAIEKLEISDHKSDLEGCKKLVKTLVNLSLCEAETWPGHISNLNQILFRFEKEVADSLSSGGQMLVSGITSTNNSASSYSQTNFTTMQAIDTPSNAFTGFEPWQPLRIERADVSSCLRELIWMPLDLEKERRSGYIYAYRTRGIFGFVKIGHTTRDIDTRLAEWQVQCRHNPEPVLGSHGQVPHVARVEKLIHAELKDFRHKQTKCICGTIHIEWFEVSHLDVAVVVEKWSAWMETMPYDTNGWLKRQHPEWLEELCKPSVLPSKTPRGIVTQYKHVEQLEKRFEFAGKTNTASFNLTNW